MPDGLYERHRQFYRESTLANAILAVSGSSRLRMSSAPFSFMC